MKRICTIFNNKQFKEVHNFKQYISEWTMEEPKSTSKN